MANKNKAISIFYFFLFTLIAVLYSTFGYETNPTSIDYKAGYQSYIFIRFILLFFAITLFIKTSVTINKFITTKKIRFEKIIFLVTNATIFALGQLMIIALLSLHTIFSDYGLWKQKIDTAEQIFKNKNFKISSIKYDHEIKNLNKAIKISKENFKNEELVQYTVQLKQNFEKKLERLPASTKTDAGNIH